MKKYLLSLLLALAIPSISLAAVINTGWQYDTTAQVQYPYPWPYQNPNIGIGTSSPYAKLSVVGLVAATNYTATSTTATSTFGGGLEVGNTPTGIDIYGPLGIISIASSTPTFPLTVNGAIAGSRFVGTATASSTYLGGIDAARICISGTTICLSNQTNGTVTSVGLSSSDSSLTISNTPVTTSGTLGAVLNLGHQNNWTTLQTFTTVGIGTSTPAQTLGIQGNALISGNITSVANITATGTLAVLNSSLIGTSTFNGEVRVSNGRILDDDYVPATSTTQTISMASSTSQTLRIGTAAVTVTLSDIRVGSVLRLEVCNPASGTAGTITWAALGTWIRWSGGTVPTQTTTANACDLWTFSATSGTTTPGFIHGAQIVW